MNEREESPFYLRGNYSPVVDEKTVLDLPVQGAIPPELRGVYIRNGPNPRGEAGSHWFTGDGMLHAVRLEEGRALSYRNRWVRTRLFESPELPLIDEQGRVDRSRGVANTHIIRHAGNLFALVESSFPTRVTADLETLGPYDYEGKLQTGMTAHPKVCPRTGELHFFGYGFFEPHLVYHRATAAGELVQSEEIDVGGPTMIHDFAITENYVVFMDLPVVFDLEKAVQGILTEAEGDTTNEKAGAGMPYHWSDGYPARLGVMPRSQPGAKVRWFEIQPCYVFHPYNAYEDGTSIVFDVCRYPDLWRGDSANFSRALPHRFTIDLASDRVGEQNLFEEPAEFPRIDDRLNGSKARYGYVVGAEDLTRLGEHCASVIKHDLDHGSRTQWSVPAGSVPSEAVFVPASENAGEDEGWLLFYCYDGTRDLSDLLILDATQLDSGPVARIGLPGRVPYGFHGNWFADEIGER